MSVAWLCVGARAASAETPADPDAAQKPRREPLHLGIDWTLGFGKVAAVDSRMPTGSLQTMARPVLTQAQVGISVFVPRATYDITEDVSAGIRLPFSYGNLGNITYEGGHSLSLGNLELSGEVRRRFSPAWLGAARFALTLPTALGAELPRTQDELDRVPPGTFDQSEANKFSLNQAAAAVYGYEESALFWSKRIGLTPGIEARWVRDKLHVTPFFRMANLVDTHASSAEPYRMELVLGAGGGYRVLEWLDVGLRAWAAVAPVRRDGSPVGAGVASPEVRVLFGERKENALFVAAVLPFAGSNVDPHYFGAFRAGIHGAF